MHFLFLFVLFLIGILNGFINVTGGGGGLITTPLLLALGLSPYAALATSKFVPIGGLVSGGAKYYKEKVVTKNKSLLLLAIVVCLGGFIAANLTLSISVAVLKYLIISATVFMLLLLIFAKDKKNISGENNSESTKSPSLSVLFWSFLVSIYQGSIGIGGGIFLAAVFRNFMRYSYLASAALMSVLTILIACISAATFALKGVVNFEYGVPLFFGSIIGGYIGAHVAIKKGDKLLKIITVVVSIALLVKVLLT